MITEVQSLLDQYTKWLKDKTQLKQINDAIEITTPYLDRHNDYIQIYVKKDSGGYLLTDDRYTIEDLESTGCDLSSKKRQDLLNLVLNGFGIKIENNALLVKTTQENFALKKHNLIQAILAVNDLFYVSKPLVANIFLDDVLGWLDLNDIRYTPNVKFTGRSGYDHYFDFVIPKSRQAPERLFKVINRPNKESAQSFVFSWIDTKEVRTPETKALAFLNDAEITPSVTVLDAFRSYDISPILWSNREEVREPLYA